MARSASRTPRSASRATVGTPVPLELQPFVYAPLEQAIVIPKGDPLGPAVEAAMKEIVRNGTYAKIMAKWGGQNIAYDSPDDVLYRTRPEQAP